MKLPKVKELLIKCFKRDFDINKLVNINSSETQDFLFTVGFEYKAKGVWHEVYMDVEGIIYKNTEDSHHNPIGDGRTSEDQSSIYIDSWNVNKVTIILDGKKATFDISNKELGLLPLLLTDKIMDWISTEDRMPLAYKTGMFDGKKSDEVIAEDINGKRYLATYYEGTLDSTEFKDWYYMDDNFDIKEPIVRFLEIPE